MGIVKNTLYQEFHCPQSLLLEYVVEFVSYSSSDFPPLYKKSIPIMSMMAQIFIDGEDLERSQLPHKLYWVNTTD